ncbi:hypothetical protein Celaphus_00000920 [Cervus elaphus hippelaphus]|uniref:Uncharacterized protein n=1 Tax=Cervus elaphus hippelaphus TaxID=46360 RepID=A0A212D967_CEREH|nr:hypothetical protein Celaphus_00000920 [Cervus elaphus hippelaphus]
MWFAARPGNEHCQVPAAEARPACHPGGISGRRGPGELAPEWRKVAERPLGIVRARADRRPAARCSRAEGGPASRLRAGRRGGPRAAGAGQDRRESRGGEAGGPSRPRGQALSARPALALWGVDSSSGSAPLPALAKPRRRPLGLSGIGDRGWRLEASWQGCADRWILIKERLRVSGSRMGESGGPGETEGRGGGMGRRVLQSRSPF